MGRGLFSKEENDLSNRDHVKILWEEVFAKMY